MKKIFFYVAVTLCFFNMQCDDELNVIDDSCTQSVVFDSNAYENLVTDHFDFVAAEIVDDCINVEIGSSGCDGESWEFNLVDSGVVAESSPEQRYLKLKLVNTELCDAYFEKIISFDLTPIQVSGSNEIILHIDGLEGSLNYEY